MLTNFHTHTSFCHGNDNVEDMVKAAIQKGFKVIGISTHAPYKYDPNWNQWAMDERNIDKYKAEVSRVKKLYKDDIQIYLGLEMDYIPGKGERTEYREGCDYIIGSNHRIFYNEHDIYFGWREAIEYLLNNCFDNDPKKFVQYYYQGVSNMVSELKPDIIGHMDLIKMNNRDVHFFDENEQWYIDEVTKALQAIAKANCIVEINTSAIYAVGLKEAYPSRIILEKAYELEIPIMINSDSHDKKFLDACFEEQKVILKDIGYKSQRVLYDNEWTDIDL